MDYLSLGLDIGGWDEAKKQRLVEFINLFDKLSMYDGKVMNPILGGGLTEFNASIAETNKLLGQLNAGITNLNSVEAVFGSNRKKSTQATAEMNDEERIHLKLIKDQYDAEIKLGLATTEQAKSTMAAKLQLSEQSKLMLEQVKSENALTQQRLAQKKADADLLASNRTKAAQDKKDAADASVAAKAQAASKRQQVADSKAAEKASLEEAKVTEALTNDYRLLELALKDQATAYSNLYINKGKGAPETKAALADYAATAGIITDIDKNLNKASGATQAWGAGLRTTFGYLRNIAYILPGIGIAGIFNLAFEAIAAAAAELQIFDSQMEKHLEREAAENKLYTEQIGLQENLNKLRKEYNETFGVDFDFDKLQQLQTDITRQQADDIQSKKVSRGYDKDILSINELTNAELRLKQAENAIQPLPHPGGISTDVDELKKSADLDFKRIDELNKAIKKYGEILLSEKSTLVNVKDTQIKTGDITDQALADRGIHTHVFQTPDGAIYDKTLVEKGLAAAKEQLSYLDAIHKVEFEKLKELNDAKNDLENKRLAFIKQKEDEARALRLAYTKDDISVNQAKNQVILSDDITAEKRRISTIYKLRDEQKGLNQADYLNVTTNLSSTETDKAIALKKRDTDNRKADIKADEDVEKVREDYRLRRVKADTEIAKAEAQTISINNEKIFNDINQSLGDRLTAYAVYVAKKREIQDLELAKDLDTKALRSDDPTARKEIAALTKATEQEKAAIIADAKEKSYEIVYSYLSKELKDVKDQNIILEDIDKEQYINELRRNNDKYDKKKISLERYQKERIKINEKYERIVLDEAIAADEEELARLKKVEDEKVDIAISAAQAKLTRANASGDENEIHKAQGELDAAFQSKVDFDKAVEILEDKYANDRLKRQKLGHGKEIDEKKLWWKAIEDIEKALYKGIKQVVDAGYAHRLAMVEKQKALIDEQYGYEIAAIEKSSLTAKDKAALDIQLNAQKSAYDKAALVEERRIKTEQAEFDKKLSIAHIIFGTAAAIIAAGAVTPKAVSAGIVGAIELATAIATPIPSFKEGTKSHKGGLARYGEDGIEIIKKPYSSPYFVMTETVSYLPKFTEIIPIKDSPEFNEKQQDNWEQTRWLAMQLRKNNKEVKNIVQVTVNNDLAFEMYKRVKLYGN